MVKNLLSLLSTRQTTILSGASILMLTVLASRFLGLIRDRLLAYTFTPDTTAIFLASFRIPDLIFQLLIFGALSVAFIPIFTEYIEQKGESKAFEFASDTLNVFLFAFVIITTLVFIFIRPLTNLIVPGFSDHQQLLTAQLTQVILFGQVLLVIGSFFAGIAQSYQRFIIPSLAGVFYNVGVIIGIVLLTPYLGIYGPALGVVIGAALHVLVQLPLINSLGFRHSLHFNPFDKGVLEIIRLMSLRTIGLAVEQINETVGVILASLISTASVTYLTFAQHLQMVPVGLFGATMAQAALPILAQARSKKDNVSFNVILLTTLHQILFLTVPVMAILIVLRIPVVRLVFGASQFNWEATVLTGRTLAFLATGLTAQALSLLLVRGFYALKDTKTPVIASIATVSINIVLSYLFVTVLHWEVWSLGLAYSIATNFSFVFLLYFLSRKVGGFNLRDVFIPAVKVLFAATVAAISLYMPIKALDTLVFDTTKTVNLIILTSIASTIGLVIYGLLVWSMQVKELYTFGNLIKKIYHMRTKVTTEEMVDSST